MRGVGKSNISRRLGFLTKRPVLATDLLVEYETGQPIPEYVADHGWSSFRDKEFAVLQRIGAMDNVIVDCGGGIVVDVDVDTGTEFLSERKIDALRSRGPVIWLRGDIERLVAKTATDPNRPTLSETTAAGDLMRRREPFYREAADVVLDVEGRKRSAMALQLALQFATELNLSDELVASLRTRR